MCGALCIVYGIVNSLRYCELCAALYAIVEEVYVITMNNLDLVQLSETQKTSFQQEVGELQFGY